MTVSLAQLRDKKHGRLEWQKAAQMLEVIRRTGASVRLDVLRESMSPDIFDALLGDNMEKRLAKGYKIWSPDWENIVNVRKNVSMLTQHTIRMGQFANLDATADTGGEFQEFTAPADADISYSVGGYGNIISVDFKARQSDHLNYFGNVSEEAGKAGRRTLDKWIFYTKLQLNPTVDDGNSLFDSTNHVNDSDPSGVGKAMTYANVHATNELIMAQTDGNSEPVFIEGKWIICGTANQAAAKTIVKAEFNPDSANREPNYFKDVLKGVIVSPYLGNDWYLSADKTDIEGLEIGFLDDKKEPQLFYLNPEVSDTHFTTLKYMWRVQSFWGGNWVDWRGIARGSQNV